MGYIAGRLSTWDGWEKAGMKAQLSPAWTELGKKMILWILSALNKKNCILVICGQFVGVGTTTIPRRSSILGAVTLTLMKTEERGLN